MKVKEKYFRREMVQRIRDSRGKESCAFREHSPLTDYVYCKSMGKCDCQGVLRPYAPPGERVVNSRQTTCDLSKTADLI